MKRFGNGKPLRACLEIQNCNLAIVNITLTIAK